MAMVIATSCTMAQRWKQRKCHQQVDKQNVVWPLNGMLVNHGKEGGSEPKHFVVSEII